MALFDFLKPKPQPQEVVAKETQSLDKNKSLADFSDIYSKPIDRAKADVQLWRDGLTEWERPDYPDRYSTQQLYKEIALDDSVKTHLNSILYKILGTEFEVGTKNADKFEPNSEKTDFLKKAWFEMVINYALESEMYGFTLVELKPAVNGTYTTDLVNLIERHLVIPEKNEVRKYARVNQNTVDYTNPIYADRLLQIGDKNDKGLFNNLAVLYIYKKNALAFWSNYQSKFGVPPVIVQTDLTNQQGVNTLVSFLQEMRSNSFALVSPEDNVSVLNGVGTDAHQTFNELIKWCDGQIAKVLEGQTMTSADGSSRSQAEVHERVSESWNLARLRRIERVVNEQLFPILNRDSLGYENLVFRFKEKKDIDSIINRALILSQAGYKIESQYLSEAIGMPLETIETEMKETQNILNAVNNLYNSDICC